jgi:hypothetical protein
MIISMMLNHYCVEHSLELIENYKFAFMEGVGLFNCELSIPGKHKLKNRKPNDKSVAKQATRSKPQSSP